MNAETRAKIDKWIQEKKVTEVVIPGHDVQPVSGLRQEVLQGNNISLLRNYPENTFTAVVTDPPYGMEFMGKEWDAPWKAHDPGSEDLSTANKMRMFQDWNEVWAAEVIRVLKPGGHLLSFGGTRTYHRMVCGIEEAGFQIRDKIDEYCEMDGYLAWVHGQGFPKSLNIGKAMDKEAGAKRPVVGYDASRARPNRLYDGGAIGNIGGTGNISDRTDNGATITAPVTDEAKLWEGYGTALKPAHEPIAVFGKGADPLAPTVPFKYEGKASGKERNRGCENLFWLIDTNGRTYAIPKEDYDRMAAENETRKNEEGFQKHRISQGNIWPTVKPLDLMRYLVRMVKMPGENLILDPFMGSGTTIVACILEGCGYVGIDMDEVAVRIARHRIEYAKTYGVKGYE